MNAREAKRLRVGDRVTWGGNAEDRGVVIEIGYCAVKIDWEDGQVGLIHHNDMRDVDRLAGEK
jgi:hypothetical protein